MRTQRFELLRPHEILHEKSIRPIVYLPVGPLEWHGPAMPIGTDPLIAEAVARQSASYTGGVVMPTLYVGTERERSASLLEAKGFDDTSQYIVGMDVPRNCIRSLYSKEDVFGMMIREFLNLLVKQGYLLIVIVNAHMATGQVNTLQRQAVEFSNETDSAVSVFSPNIPLDETDLDQGHGTIRETSMMMFLNPDSVDLKQFPDKPVRLKNTDWGIADSCTFALQPNEDKTIVYDPRDSEAQLGGFYIQRAVDSLVRQVESDWESITTSQHS
ncbi:creatininase family protein [bacterium]|nr:creatininase family protein [candidate division CSSED10-310 bacterium]